MKIFPWLQILTKNVTFSELAVIGAFCRCSIAEKRIRQYIFFSTLTPLSLDYIGSVVLMI